MRVNFGLRLPKTFAKNCNSRARRVAAAAPAARAAAAGVGGARTSTWLRTGARGGAYGFTFDSVGTGVMRRDIFNGAWKHTSHYSGLQQFYGVCHFLDQGGVSLRLRWMGW